MQKQDQRHEKAGVIAKSHHSYRDKPFSRSVDLP